MAPKLLTVLVAMVLAGGCRRRPVEMETAQEAANAREKRQTPVTVVAPVPAPTGLPLVGEDGVDVDGYPRRYVDRAALRRLLRDKRHDELNADARFSPAGHSIEYLNVRFATHSAPGAAD